MHGLQELHLIKQNHDLLTKMEGKLTAPVIETDVTILFTEVDFLQAIAPPFELWSGEALIQGSAGQGLYAVFKGSKGGLHVRYPQDFPTVCDVRIVLSGRRNSRPQSPQCASFQRDYWGNGHG